MQIKYPFRNPSIPTPALNLLNEMYARLEQSEAANSEDTGPTKIDRFLTSQIGLFVYGKSGQFQLTDGYLAVSPGSIVNGATVYPIWAAKYPEFIVESDISFPANVAGMFLRNIDGNAAAEGVFQDSDNKAHTHTFVDNGSNQVGITGGPTPFANPTGTSDTTASSGGIEARPVNRAYQLYTIVDTILD